MTAMLLCGDALLRLPSARIARDNVASIRDVAALLDEARSLRDKEAKTIEDATARGYAAGKEAALIEMRAVLSKTIAAFEEDIRKESRHRETAAANAAMYALEKIIGAKEPREVVIGLVHEAMRHAKATGVVIVVSPDMVEPVQNSLSAECETEVRGDLALDDLACRIVNKDGQVIADLDTQLSELRSRWGLVQKEGHGDA